MKVRSVIKYSGSSDVDLFPLSCRTEDKNANKNRQRHSECDTPMFIVTQ